jgi:signal transduction histidine kinase
MDGGHRVRKAVIGLLMTGVLVVMGALRGVSLLTSREETLRAAEARATSLSLILAEYLSQTFAAADAALRQLSLHSRRVGGPLAGEAEWMPALTAARAALPGIGALTVCDRDLMIRYSTRGEIVGQSRQDVATFRDALAEPSDALIVGAPFHSPVTDLFVVPLGRQLRTADGRVEGVVVASLMPANLRPFFHSVDVGERGAVWVYHQTGVLIAREPSRVNAIGTPAAGHVVVARVAAGESRGVVRAPFEPAGAEQIGAFQQAPDVPIIIAVSLNRDEILSPWRREAMVSAVLFAVVAAALSASLVFLFRQMDAHAAAEGALAAARQHEADQLRLAHDRLAETLVREQAARQEAESAVALKDRFVMTVSHELRTPLTAIAGWSRMLVDGMVPSEQQPHALRTIERNAQAQMRLIEDLLDVAGSLTGKLRLDIREISVDDVVRHAVEAIRPAAAAKNLMLEVQVGPGLDRVDADAARLQQVIWNLLSNAVKFTPSGGRIGVLASRAGATAEITVTDTGQGIPPELLTKVFEPFRQGAGDLPRRHGGLGLGLAIVRSLVELHGGTITAHSDGEGSGSTFIVRIRAPQRAAPPVVEASDVPA